MEALSFALSFQVVMGIGAALLVTLLGYRAIESIFYFIGYAFGESKAKEARLRALEEKEAAGMKAAGTKATG
jgi:membrane protein DedA with SNARE-associated domain